MSNQDPAPVWRQRLDDLAQSGLSVREWCQARGISKSQYTYWRRRIAEAEAAAPERATWLSIPAAASTASSSLTLRIAGAQIDLQPGFDPDLLRSVVAALGGAPC